jgi:hypothetical protein
VDTPKKSIISGEKIKNGVHRTDTIRTISVDMQRMDDEDGAEIDDCLGQRYSKPEKMPTPKERSSQYIELPVAAVAKESWSNQDRITESTKVIENDPRWIIPLPIASLKKLR